MKKGYVREFFLRGMCFGGFGPIVAGIVLYIISLTGVTVSLSGGEVLLAVVSTYILAFVHAGVSVFNQIESWSVAKSTLLHLGSLYLVYALCYIVNSWIPFEPTVLLIFTAAFVLLYFVIWLTVYFSVRAIQKRLNQSLK